MPEPVDFDITLQAKAYRVVRTRIQAVLDNQQLNATLWSLLTTVASAGNGIRLSEVAHLLGVKAPLVTMMADQLIERELIERVPHMIDKRAKLLVITAPGKKMVGTIQVELNNRLRPLMQGLSRKELQAYIKVTTQLAGDEDNI